MYQHLEEFVIGQERAKKVLSVAMYNHYKRLNSCISSAQQQGEHGGYVEHINIQPPIGTRKYEYTPSLSKANRTQQDDY